MEHVVFFAAPDGTPAFRRVAGLEDAVRLVEHLRNVEGLHEVSVHPIGEEVPLAFRTWYRVELPGEAGQPAAPQAVEVLPEVPAQAEVPAVEASLAGLPLEDAQPPADGEEPGELVPAVEPVAAANGHGETARSLGFFTR